MTRPIGRGFTFTIEFLGDGAHEAALVRRNKLATADLNDLTYDLGWCLVRFRSRLITAELAGYALDVLYGLVHALEEVEADRSYEVVLAGSGDTVGFRVGGDGWVVVTLERGSIERPSEEVLRTFAVCLGDALRAVVERYPDLGDRADLRALGRRAARLGRSR